MADEIAVPTAELAELLGLPPDVDDATLRKAMAELLASVEAREAREAEVAAAAAEQRLQAEDRRIVAAACNEGKLPASRIEFWCSALQQDRARNRAVIASLSPGIISSTERVSADGKRVAVDGDLERVHNKVMAQLGVPTNPLKSVAASGDPQADLREREVLDSVGLPTAQVPKPVVIQPGTHPSQWTPKQAQDAMLRRLGPRFFPGTEKPPAGDVVYFPSPNDVVEFKDGQWIEKRPYKEVP